MNDLPGYEIEEVFGEVFGLTVRSRNLGSQIGAGLKSIIGGELGGMTKMLAQGREEAIERLVGGGGAEGRERDRRDALRHVGARLDLDRDLRLRDGRTRAEAEDGSLNRAEVRHPERHVVVLAERRRLDQRRALHLPLGPEEVLAVLGRVEPAVERHARRAVPAAGDVEVLSERPVEARGVDVSRPGRLAARAWAKS